MNGIATVEEADALLADYPEAQLIVRVRATEVFPNCPRYIHKMQFVEPSKFVPRAGCETPVPDWKRPAWSHGVPAAHDPANKCDPIE